MDMDKTIGIAEYQRLASLVVILSGERKDGKGDYEGVFVEKSQMFSSLGVQIAKDAGCKEIRVEKKSR